MAVPATQGKQCKYLEEMEIGDYIRCTYTATAANVAGEFSDLGGFVDSYEKHQQQVDSEGNPVVEADGKPVMDTVKKSYDELPVIPGNVVKGYFYFLKVDKGLLIADRKLQKNISYGVLNSAQMTTGWKFKNICLIRLGTRDEYVRYLEKSNLNGTIIIQDSNVWHDFNLIREKSSTS